MEFAFNPDQEMLRRTLADFAARELAPAYASRDQDEDLPRSLVLKLGELGLLAPMTEERHGGQALDYVSLGIAHEEIGRADFNAAYVLLLSGLVGAIVSARGDDRQRAEYLPPICRGETVTALAVTEPGGGSDAAHIRMQARRDGDSYLLSGEKTSISLGSWADTALVMARTGTLEQGAHGVSAFYVDLRAPGVSRARFRDLGTRAIGRGQLFFDEVRVPAAARIGAEGAGFVQVMQGFDFSRSLIGLMCIGAAQQSVDETVKYVTERQAFGAALARFEGVSFPAGRSRGQAARRALTLLRGVVVARSGQAARMARRGMQMVGAGTGGPGDPSMPAAARPSRLQPRPAASAASARRYRARDRRRHRADHEDAGGARGYRQVRPSLLAAARKTLARAARKKTQPHVIRCPAAFFIAQHRRQHRDRLVARAACARRPAAGPRNRRANVSSHPAMSVGSGVGRGINSMYSTVKPPRSSRAR